MRAEYFLDGLGLGNVAHMGRSAVYVDVVNLFRFQSGIVQCSFHDQLGSQAFGVGGRDVVGISRHAGTRHFRVDFRTARFGVFQLLEHQASCAFSHDKAVAACAERARGACRVVVAGGQCLHGVEAAHAGGPDGRFGSPAQDDAGLAQTDEVECVCQSVGGRGACRGRGVVGAVEAVHDGNVAARDVRDHLGNEERAVFGP